MNFENAVICLRDQLSCPLCHDLFHDPHQFVTCFHKFCRQCAIHKLSERSECPTCRNPTWKKDLQKCLQLDTAVQVLMAILKIREEQALIHHGNGGNSISPTDRTTIVTGDTPTKHISVHDTAPTPGHSGNRSGSHVEKGISNGDSLTIERSNLTSPKLHISLSSEMSPPPPSSPCSLLLPSCLQRAPQELVSPTKELPSTLEEEEYTSSAVVPDSLLSSQFIFDNTQLGFGRNFSYKEMILPENAEVNLCSPNDGSMKEANQTPMQLENFSPRTALINSTLQTSVENTKSEFETLPKKEKAVAVCQSSDNWNSEYSQPKPSKSHISKPSTRGINIFPAVFEKIPASSPIISINDLNEGLDADLISQRAIELGSNSIPSSSNSALPSIVSPSSTINPPSAMQTVNEKSADSNVPNKRQASTLAQRRISSLNQATEMTRKDGDGIKFFKFLAKEQKLFSNSNSAIMKVVPENLSGKTKKSRKSLPITSVEKRQAVRKENNESVNKKCSPIASTRSSSMTLNRSKRRNSSVAGSVGHESNVIVQKSMKRRKSAIGTKSTKLDRESAVRSSTGSKTVMCFGSTTPIGSSREAVWQSNFALQEATGELNTIVSSRRSKQECGKRGSRKIMPLQPHFSIVVTGMCKDDKLHVKNALDTLQRLGIQISQSDEVDSETTHVVTTADSRFCCSRTIKYLQALLMGVWIVDFNWLTNSTVEGALQQESLFEIKGDCISGVTHAPKLGRQRQKVNSAALFCGFRFFLYESFVHPSPPKTSLQTLIVAGGVVPRTTSYEFRQGENYHCSGSNAGCVGFKTQVG
ncbi:hypothetical protein BKA69DRAFT_408289 [Paraphysoderma sedebokerense]|nr:hypothetical protein BKA69DRAFT_408289 [Paraphysoderma sedebokerense]